MILDSNLDPRAQTNWLEATLSRSTARWKFVAYQVLDLESGGHRLAYRAYDAEGKLRDQMVIEK